MFATQAYNVPRRRWQALQLLPEAFEGGVVGNGAGAKPAIHESLWHSPHQTARH